MPVSPFLVSYTLTQPTEQVPTGTLYLVANEGDSFGPLTVELLGLGYGIETMDAPATGPGNYAYQRAGLPPGTTLTVRVYDASTAKLPGFTQEVVIDPAPNPVPGCTNPDADNYDPSATQDNGRCVFTPRLRLAPLPELAPLGVPLPVTLAAVAVPGKVPAPATVLLELAALGAAVGVQLRVDGYLFTSGPLIVPGRFVDAPSLLAALQAQPALSAAYAFTQPAATQVLVTARQLGLPGTPVVSSTYGGVSDTTFIKQAATPGQAAFWSQQRYRWACYVEVWAGCGSVFGGPVDKATAVLAQRITQDYRADNAYAFDVAQALRGFTGHAYPRSDGSCPDRLVSYFLRFGEEYADVATGLRRARTTYESPVAWGLEAVELGPLVGSGLRLLTRRPAPWVVALGDWVPVLLLAPVTTTSSLVLRTRPATSRTTADLALGREVATGLVTRTSSRLNPAEALSGQLLDAQGGIAGGLVGMLSFTATGQALTFVNRQGGTDTVYFTGTPEDSTKRTPATYTTASGPALASAEVQPTTKLWSGLLDYPTWDWLRRELGSSPTAWLETDAGPVGVMLSDLATEADNVKGEYSLSIDYQLAPVRGLSS